MRNELELLLQSFGRVTPPIDPTQLRRLHDRAEFPQMLGWIKNSMKLDLRVGMRIVEDGPERTPMWIETPRPMPLYGTDEFKSIRVIVNVRRDVLKSYSFDWIVAGFAHELSHVILFSIRHPLQHNERAVDLTAMIKGYRNFLRKTDRTKIHGGIVAFVVSVLALPLGILFVPGRTKSSLGYLSKFEKRAACRYLEKAERASP